MLCLFFFQAEDGIRDLVRSRGLGDVYKRQTGDRYFRSAHRGTLRRQALGSVFGAEGFLEKVIPVSYTHLTLPTSDLV